MNLFNQKQEKNKNIKIEKNADFSEIQEKYKKLRSEIEYHNNLYYNEDNPIISDMEYDKLIQELKKMEESNPELIVKTPEVLRFKPVEKFGEVYILGDTEKKTFWLAKITYDLSAFK